jgi:hypothetical protein
MCTNDASELDDDTTRVWVAECCCVLDQLDPPRAPHAGVVAPARARADE